MNEAETPVEDAGQDGAGRPSLYKPEYAEQAEKLCRFGATDVEIAEFFDVSVRTVHRWKLDHEEFCHSISIGKESADSRVERALYERATGFTFKEDQAFKCRDSDGAEKVEVVTLEKQVPAETAAMIFWLKNRKKAEWRDKVEQEITGANGGAIAFTWLQS